MVRQLSIPAHRLTFPATRPRETDTQPNPSPTQRLPPPPSLRPRQPPHHAPPIPFPPRQPLLTPLYPHCLIKSQSNPIRRASYRRSIPSVTTTPNPPTRLPPLRARPHAHPYAPPTPQRHVRYILRTSSPPPRPPTAAPRTPPAPRRVVVTQNHHNRTCLGSHRGRKGRRGMR